MAIVGAPLPPEQWPPGAAAAINRWQQHGATVARQAGQQPPATPEMLAAWAEITRAIAAEWAALDHWKRWRWSLCAWKHRDHAATPDPQDGDSGFRLYLACYLDQAIVAPHQPISPCARRVWDPGANYWDFTP